MKVRSSAGRDRPVSPRAQELGRRIAECVREYRSRHPSVGELEAQRALNAAFAQSRDAEAGVVQTLGLLVAAAIALAVFYFAFFDL